MLGVEIVGHVEGHPRVDTDVGDPLGPFAAHHQEMCTLQTGRQFVAITRVFLCFDRAACGTGLAVWLQRVRSGWVLYRSNSGFG